MAKSQAERSKAWREKNKGYFRKYQREMHFSLRYSLIREFGPNCKDCGFSDARILHFDHVNNDGFADKFLGGPKKTGKKGRQGYQLYQKRYELVRAAFQRGELQILCPNCNYLKRFKQLEETWKTEDANDEQLTSP